MKSLKLLLLTLICSFAHPAESAYAIVSRVENNYSVTSKVLSKKKIFPWEIILGYGFRDMSNKEAITVCVISFILFILSAWYIFAVETTLVNLFTKFIVIGCGISLGFNVIRHIIILAINNHK